MSISNNLKQLREEKGILLKELAAYLDVSIGTVSNYERGIHMPDLDTLNKLASFYGVTTDYLIGRTRCRDSIEGLNQHISEDYTVDDFLQLLPRLSKRDKVFLVYALRILENSVSYRPDDQY